MRILTAALAALVLFGTAHAKVVYVDDNAASGGDGTSWASAHKYLQDALTSVASGDDIWVAEGTYKPDQGGGKTAGDRTSPFLLVNGVGMYGGFKGTETTRTPDGDGNQTILSGEINLDKTLWSLNVVSGVDLNANTTMNGFRITKGNANGEGVLANGAGMYLKNSSPTLTNCVFTGNSASGDWSCGGGMYNYGSSSPTLTNCTFTGNSARNGGGGMYNSSSPTLTHCVFTGNSASGNNGGGGMFNSSSSSPTLTDCVFTGNSAGDGGGGGMFNSGHYSSPTLTNCVFTGNSVSGGNNGGGMYNYKSSPTLTDCVFTNNGGGGMFNSSSSPTLTDCVFTNNNATAYGGGMWNSSSSPTLTNCVFSGNSASATDAGGGGMYNNKSSPTLTDCVFTGNSASGGGGGGMWNHYKSSPTLTNCVFTGNSASGNAGRGGGMYNYTSSTLTNCVFTGNSARNGGGMYTNYYSSSPTLTNCVFWKNFTDGNEGHGIDGDSLKGSILVAAVEPQFPGDPDAKDAVYFTSNILQGWDGDTRAFSADPLFVNIDDPDGPDDEWFTEDDGLRLKEGSPAIDAGYNASLPVDKGDVDGDGDKTELIPLDLAGYVRVQNAKVDLGPYEFGDSRIPTYVVSLVASPNNSGSLTGEGPVEKGKSTTISATPNAGYLFTGWSGDATGTSNPLTIMVEASRDITANFAQDTNDDDGDGLSNYAELVTHGTKADDNDTDNDGLLDNEEIQIGTNPLSSDATLVNFFNAKTATDQSTARTTALAEGRTAGINAVKAKPGDYGLHTELDLNASVDSAVTTTRTAALDEGRTVGINAVKANPSQHGLYTQADLNASAASSKTSGIAEGKTAGIEAGKELGRSEGQSTGIAAVKADPAAHNLVTKDAYDQMVEQLINSSDSGSTTPFVHGWFYYPNRGWMWTNRTSYPYFYDSSTDGWMYFKSGEDKPRFYHYGTKAWVTLGE